MRKLPYGLPSDSLSEVTTYRGTAAGKRVAMSDKGAGAGAHSQPGLVGRAGNVTDVTTVASADTLAVARVDTVVSVAPMPFAKLLCRTRNPYVKSTQLWSWGTDPEQQSALSRPVVVNGLRVSIFAYKSACGRRLSLHGSDDAAHVLGRRARRLLGACVFVHISDISTHAAVWYASLERSFACLWA